MNYSSLRTWIAQTLAGIGGLQSYDRPPGTIITPCAYPQRFLVDTRADTAFGETATVEIAVLLSRADDSSAWELVDSYMSRGGTSSIIDALETTQPSSGFDSLAVVSWEIPSDMTANDIPYIGVVITCEVIG